MKLLFAFSIFVAVTAVNSLPALAYDLSVTEVNKPYEVVEITGDPEKEHVYLGELGNFPIMYELNLIGSSSIVANIKQRHFSSSDPLNFSLIVIRKNDTGGGVTEVARMRPGKDGWTVVKDSKIGITFKESDYLRVDVEPGVYRIEISTPDNLGRYILTFGDEEESSGYLQSLKDVRAIQKFFGFSILKMLTSSLVYYPLGILLLLFVFNRTIKYRKKIAHAD
ncbi:hypothetical protein KC865_02085 [Candidatus Kaiserbacteria bacterium]|nr:hypothetical protein [Candidatus Kaiserbacteria bacterium]USN92189.1 MAG: hypothetical protein H6782_04930 [Candidatus Nomurabacteria bacterium]